jgi:DNA-binding transcriptional LysR family regulator
LGEDGRDFIGRNSLRPDAQLLVNDVATMHSACLAGYGMAQVMELGIESLLANGRLVNVFPSYDDERFPLYAYYSSRHLLPNKTRAFLDFVLKIIRVGP